MSIDWLALTIALTGLAGALLLAIDAVLGPGQRFKAETLRIQLETLKKNRNYWQESTQALKQPPYTPEEIRALLEEEERNWGPTQKGLEQQLDRFDGKLSRYESLVANCGFLGVILLVVSFLLQAALVVRDGSRETTATAHTSGSTEEYSAVGHQRR